MYYIIIKIQFEMLPNDEGFIKVFIMLLNSHTRGENPAECIFHTQRDR